jgi:hypothetical protein
MSMVVLPRGDYSRRGKVLAKEVAQLPFTTSIAGRLVRGVSPFRNQHCPLEAHHFHTVLIDAAREDRYNSLSRPAF